MAQTIAYPDFGDDQHEDGDDEATNVRAAGRTDTAATEVADDAVAELSSRQRQLGRKTPIGRSSARGGGVGVQG